MESTASHSRGSKKIAEYFVICGLTENPVPYDLTKVLAHTEEITQDPDRFVDFTAFHEPIVDIQFISLKERDGPPNGYEAIQRSHSGACKTNIKGSFGEEVYLCYRRGRDAPPITNISIFTEDGSQTLRSDAHSIKQTLDGHNANLCLNPLTHPDYLSYTRAKPESGIDQLAVIDICLIYPDKNESCPPAYQQIMKPLGGSMIHKRPFVCFRKSLVKQHTIAYEPEVLFTYRVPLPTMELNTDEIEEEEEDLEDSTEPEPLDPDICQVAKFCLPWGASIESWSVSQDYPQPNHFTFVLTNESYQRLYGVAFTFHEPYDTSKLDKDKCYRLDVDPELVLPMTTSSSTQQPPPPPPPIAADDFDRKEEARITQRQGHFIRSRVGDRVVGVTKTMCILSRCAFPSAYTNFLAFLYSRCQPGMTFHPIPLERYLAYFLCEVPFPSVKYPSISLELCAAPMLLQLPDETNATSSHEPFFYLLSCLGIERSLQLLIHVLTEQKIILTSVHHFLLTQIGEALTSIIFPLQWASAYIPFIYMGHVQIIQSPFPCLVGMDSRFFDFFRLPSDVGAGVTYVDLDTRNFKPVAGLESMHLPKKPLKLLKTTLNALEEEIADLRRQRTSLPPNFLLKCLFSLPGSELASEELRALQIRNDIGMRVREAFLNFMTYLLRNYRNYLHDSPEGDWLFDNEGFLDEVVDERTRPFYQIMLSTQIFVNFVRDRMYTSARDEELAYFDSLIHRLYPSNAAIPGGIHAGEPRGLSAMSISSGGSYRESTDGRSTDSQPRMNYVTEVSDAPNFVSLFNRHSLTRDNMLHIKPPDWPIRWTSPEPHRRRNPLRHSAPCLFDLVPVKWSTRLLNRLCHYSAIKLATAEEVATRLNIPLDEYLARNNANGLNVTTNSNTVVSAEGRAGGSVASLTSIPAGIGGRFPLEGLLSPVHHPSPMMARVTMSTNLGLTGLPTDYPLPSGTSSILRRSLIEIDRSTEYGKQCKQEYGWDWCKHIVASVYTLWFMLLPSYLAALHLHGLNNGAAPAATESEASNTCDTAKKAVDTCLTEAYHMFHRLLQKRICCPDQISKSYKDECIELERLRVHKHPGRRVATTQQHRRSASSCCATGELTTVFSEPSFLPYNQQDADDPPGQNVPVLPSSQSTSKLVSHKRSNSSVESPTTAAAVSAPPPPQDSVTHSAKSETDSGLLVNVAGNDEDDDGNPIAPSVDDAKAMPIRSRSNIDFIERNHANDSVTMATMTAPGVAPLACGDDMNDLGYSTLQRLPSSTMTMTTDTRSQQLPTQLSVDGAPTTSVTRQSLDSVQRPPPAMWIEQPSSELPSQSRNWPAAAQEHQHPPSSTETSDAEDSGSSDRDSSITGASSNSPEHRSTGCIPMSPLIVGGGQQQQGMPVDTPPPPSINAKKPRGSLTYLVDMISSIKDIPSVRQLLTPSPHPQPSATPITGRRRATDGDALTAGRLPRSSWRWAPRKSESAASPGLSLRGTRSGQSSPRVIRATNGTPQRTTCWQVPSSEVEDCQTLWYDVAGPLVVGNLNQRVYPASLATYISDRYGLDRPPITTGQSTTTSPTQKHQQQPDQSNASSEQSNLAEVKQLYIFLTTCNTCPQCQRFVHDEEITGEWFPEEDKQTIPCPFCTHEFEPKLMVRVQGDVRPSTAWAEPMIESSGTPGSPPPAMNTSRPGTPSQSTSPVLKALLEFSCPYMSPFRLRRSLETLIHREGDEAFRLNTFLYRHERFAWNLIWYTHRLGLPTHLLDPFSVWLMDRQEAQRQNLLTRGRGGTERTARTVLSLLQVKLSPNLPVRISLRWNSYQSVSGRTNKPLYKQWLQRKAEFKSSVNLHASSGQPSQHPPNPFQLDPNGSCPMEVTIALVLSNMRANSVYRALDALVLLRTSICLNQPLSSRPAHLMGPRINALTTTETMPHPLSSSSGQLDRSAIRRQSADGPAGQPPRNAATPDPAILGRGDGMKTSGSRGRSDLCKDSHQSAWCVRGSLYRELLFLTVTALPAWSDNLWDFDIEYAKHLDAYTTQSYVRADDCSPGFIAVACRQMLRPLTLVP